MSAPAHAELSPSTAHRWLYCPGSIELCRRLGLTSKGGAAADLGTAAHQLLETCLKSEMEPRRALGQTIMVRRDGEPVQKFPVDVSMVSAIQYALDDLAPWYWDLPKNCRGTETRVPIQATGEFGTVDVWGFDTIIGLLRVRDYKNGRKRVVAKNNPQMRLYALGLVEGVARLGMPVPDEIETGIIQPHTSTPDVPETLTIGQLAAWDHDVVRPVVREIKQGSTRCVAGDHCEWCPALGRCKTALKLAAQIAKKDFLDDILSPKVLAPVTESGVVNNAELANTLSKLPFLDSFAKAVRAEAMATVARDPNSLPGWKLVEGQSRRKWLSEPVTMKALGEKGLSVDDFAPRSLLGITAIQALLAKEDRTPFMSSHAIKPKGKPTLAPSDDPRPSFAGSAADDFADDLLED